MASWFSGFTSNTARATTSSAVTHAASLPRPTGEEETSLLESAVDVFARKQGDATANMTNFLRTEVEKHKAALQAAYNDLAILALKHSTLVDREEMLKHGYVKDPDHEARIFQINYIPNALRTMGVLNTNHRNFQSPELGYLQKREIQDLRGPINFFLDKRPPNQTEVGTEVPAHIKELLAPKNQRKAARTVLTGEMNELHNDTIQPLRQKLTRATQDLQDFIRSLPSEQS